jgi:hypothetical protein
LHCAGFFVSLAEHKQISTILKVGYNLFCFSALRLWQECVCEKPEEAKEKREQQKRPFLGHILFYNKKHLKFYKKKNANYIKAKSIT